METMFNIDARLQAMADAAEAQLAPVYAEIDAIAAYNQQKMLKAFIDNKVSERHFQSTTGYGYGDEGRDTLDRVFAQAMGAEDALVRHSILSGTHAIAIALFGVLRPGDTLLAATGAPYDTLEEVIGIRPSDGSLMEYGVKYSQVDLNKQQLPDLPAIAAAVKADPTIKMVHIQRSRGYNTRPSLTVEQIGEIVDVVKQQRSDVIVFVDNCYGEFVQRTEPCEHGADLMAGSLIKNPGGGLATNGGYICGRADLVEKCSYRMTTPGLGREIGASLGQNRSLYMGAFFAPHTVSQAVRTAAFCAAMFEKLGFGVSPASTDVRADIIQTVCFGKPEPLISFCQGMQRGAPVDAFVVPEPWDMPGYDSQVIMAAGAFTGGASIELSADAPLREPYAAYMQGGLIYETGKIGVLLAAQKMLNDGFLPL